MKNQYVCLITLALAVSGGSFKGCALNVPPTVRKVDAAPPEPVRAKQSGKEVTNEIGEPHDQSPIRKDDLTQKLAASALTNQDDARPRVAVLRFENLTPVKEYVEVDNPWYD